MQPSQLCSGSAPLGGLAQDGGGLHDSTPSKAWALFASNRRRRATGGNWIVRLSSTSAKTRLAAVFTAWSRWSCHPTHTVPADDSADCKRCGRDPHLLPKDGSPSAGSERRGLKGLPLRLTLKTLDLTCTIPHKAIHRLGLHGLTAQLAAKCWRLEGSFPQAAGPARCGAGGRCLASHGLDFVDLDRHRTRIASADSDWAQQDRSRVTVVKQSPKP